MEKIWTIGHSTRTIEEFIAALAANGIRGVADVRRFPGSRRFPHFNRERLASSLADRTIGYEHFPELGGRRKARPDSHNVAWQNASFRAFADHMETEEFRRGIARLEAFACQQGEIAMMCAEALWWRCHRALLSDYFKSNGVEVIHIRDSKNSESHPFTSAAELIQQKLSYRARV